MEAIIAEHAKEGERVILLAKQDSFDDMGEAVALIAISDRIRPNAFDTIVRFQEQGVTVKVISGDHAATVSSIAKRVGIKNADKYLSCEKHLLIGSNSAKYGILVALFGKLLIRKLLHLRE